MRLCYGGVAHLRTHYANTSHVWKRDLLSHHCFLSLVRTLNIDKSFACDAHMNDKSISGSLFGRLAPTLEHHSNGKAVGEKEKRCDIICQIAWLSYRTLLVQWLRGKRDTTPHNATMWVYITRTIEDRHPLGEKTHSWRHPQNQQKHMLLM